MIHIWFIHDYIWYQTVHDLLQSFTNAFPVLSIMFGWKLHPKHPNPLMAAYVFWQNTIHINTYIPLAFQGRRLQQISWDIAGIAKVLDVLDASSQLSSHLSGEVGRPIHSRPGGDRVRLLKIRNPHAKDDPGRSRKVEKGMGRNGSGQKTWETT